MKEVEDPQEKTLQEMNQHVEKAYSLGRCLLILAKHEALHEIGNDPLILELLCSELERALDSFAGNRLSMRNVRAA